MVRALAAQARGPGFNSRQLPAFHFLLLCRKANKLSFIIYEYLTCLHKMHDLTHNRSSAIQCFNEICNYPGLPHCSHSEHVHLPATSTPQKKKSEKKPTINSSPTMVPTAIPAMAPGDKPGRAVVTESVAMGGEVQFQYTLPLAMVYNLWWKPKEGTK